MFLDTSGQIQLVDHRNFGHADAVALFGAATVRVTLTAVIVELVALAHSRGIGRRRTLDFIEKLHVNPAVEVVHVDLTLYSEALDLLLRRLDKVWSLCDAMSFVLMKDRGLTEALTTDHHFEQAGFVRLLSV